ncbi:MAG: hypothetical protein ACXVKA_02695 [Acidimicrobiia bacterium]
MAPIGHTASYTTGLTPEQVRERTLGWFARVSYKLTVDAPDRLVIETGSQAKMRLLGGAFIAASSLPARTIVTMAPSAAGTDVTLSADDAVGFGLKTGMKGKYEKWLAEIVAGVQAATA